MSKHYSNKSVLEAAKERIEFTFNSFEKIYLSFSGGKDSTVMLHLVMEECIKRNQKIGVLFIDLEGQYKLTIDHIKNCYDLYADYIIPFWVCLPIHLRNAVSVYETHWKCWDVDAQKSWINEFPVGCIKEHEYFPFFHNFIKYL